MGHPQLAEGELVDPVHPPLAAAVVIVGRLKGLQGKVRRGLSGHDGHGLRGIVVVVGMGGVQGVGRLAYISDPVHDAVGKGVDDQ